MPKQTELKVSYSIGCKVNLGNFESADVHLSTSETWDVTDQTDDEISLFEARRYVELHKLLGPRIEDECKEMKNG
jgi:hypothetical protein